MRILNYVPRCLSPSLQLAHEVVATVDGLIALAALVQLVRIHTYNPKLKWSRQKVFHIMVLLANFGYFVFFALTPKAACEGWSCWRHVCGFTLLAIPQITFLATFLLLLSFWVDLCHQATDKEEEEEEEEDEEETSEEASYAEVEISQSSEDGQSPGIHIQGQGSGVLEKLLGTPEGRKRESCCSLWRSIKVRGRQRTVVVIVSLICALTGLFALLIWVGLGDNDIDPQLVARVHADVFAVVMLFSGGGLAFYGLLLYSKLSQLKTGKALVELSKVSWLAGLCLFCFSLRAFIVLEKNIPFLSPFHFRDSDGNLVPLWFSVYYLIGEALPSAVVLIILKDMPSRSREGSVYNSQEYALVVASLDQSETPHWVLPANRIAFPVVAGAIPSSSDRS